MPSTNENAVFEARLSKIEKGVNALIAAMNMVIDTVQQQTLLLAELAGAAKDTPGESPVVTAIDTLASAVTRMGEAIEVLSADMEALPDRLKAALERDEIGSLREAGQLLIP